MIIRLIQITIIASVMLYSLAIVNAQSGNADPLKPYTTCKVPGDLNIKQVTRRSAGDNYREVTTGNGKQKVSVVDGYRVMFAYPDLTYYFANVKIEQSAPESYAADKRILADELKYYSAIKEATAMIFTDRKILNGFEHYGIDRDKIDVGGQVATHVLFYDPAHLVVTIYFLNQSKAVFLNKRRFETIEQFHELRDEFLNSYSKCLKRVADAQH